MDDTSTVVSETLTAVLAPISQYIYPERRQHPDDVGRYKLGSPQVYAVEKWKAAIYFLDFVADDGKVRDAVRLCEKLHSVKKWAEDAYTSREERLLYKSEALRDA